MSRFHKKNKYDSDRDVSLKRAEIKSYSEDTDAFPVYIPSENPKPKKKKGKKVLLILLLIFFLLVAATAGTFFYMQYKGQKDLVSYEDVTIDSIDEAIASLDLAKEIAVKRDEKGKEVGIAFDTSLIETYREVLVNRRKEIEELEKSLTRMR